MKSNSYAMQGGLRGSGNLTDKTAFLLDAPGARHGRKTFLFWDERFFEAEVAAAA